MDMAKYAGFWVRVVASFIDGVALMVPMFALMMVYGVGAFTTIITMGESIEAEAVVTGGYYIMLVITIILQVAYYALMESSKYQATLGKLAMRIVVVNEQGNRITKGQAVGRYLSKVLSGIFYIGYIMVGITQKKQGLHDMLAKTYVVYGKAEEKTRKTIYEQ